MGFVKLRRAGMGKDLVDTAAEHDVATHHDARRARSHAASDPLVGARTASGAASLLGAKHNTLAQQWAKVRNFPVLRYARVISLLSLQQIGIVAKVRCMRIVLWMPSH